MWDKPKKFEKKLEERGKKILEKLPGVGIGKEVIGALEDVGKELGLGKSEADKRKDRTRYFHERLRAGDWDHVEKTAEVEGALGGKGTRFKGLALEALWVLTQRDKGFSLPEILQAIAGNGGAEARGGRLPNLDGTANFSEDLWRARRSAAGASTETGSTSPAPDREPSPSTSAPRRPAAPSAPRAPAPTPTSSPSPTPRTLPDCGPGRYRNPETNRCKKLPPAPSASPDGGSGRGLTGGSGAAPAGGCPPGKELNPATGRCRAVCKYGRDPLTDRCRPKPPATAAQKRQTQAEKRIEREIGKGVEQGAKYVYKKFGGLGTLKLLAKSTLVLGAGLGAYWLTKKLATLRPPTWADARSELAKAYREAKQKVRDSRPDLDWSGGEETRRNNELLFADLNAWFKEREAVMEQLEAQYPAFPRSYKGNVMAYIFDDDNPTYGDPFENTGR